MHDDFGKFLNEKQFCDVQFTVGIEEVKISAHIAIVAARSPVLKEKILSAREAFNEQLEKHNEDSDDVPKRPILDVKIPDALPDAFEKVLSYIYTDRIDCKLMILYFDIFKTFSTSTSSTTFQI